MPSATDLAINLTNVTKVYPGKVHALRGIDMQVGRGEVFGLLGPNGAGKSTLVKILLTVIRPTRAEGTMLGQRIGHKPTLARVGYLPEHHRFPEYLTGSQVIDFYASMAKVPRRQRRQRGAALLELVGMKDWGDKKVKGYSKGMRQRIGIAQALVNDPDLVVLDEPTDGVDPVGRRDIRQVISRVRDEGKTVFVNSHLLSELEMVCNRLAILVQGKVASQGTIDELTKGRQYYEITIEPGAAGAGVSAVPLLEGAGTQAAPPVAEHGNSPALFYEALGLPASAGQAHLATRGGIEMSISGHTLRLHTTDSAAIQPLIDALRARGVTIQSIHRFRPSLEDLFMEAVTDPTTGQALAPGAKPVGKGGRS